MRFTSACVAGITLLAAAGCTQPQHGAAATEVSDSAGVRIVRHVSPPADTLRVAEPTVRIGSAGLEGSNELVFAWISDVVWLPGGRLAVIDNHAPRIAVFDGDGALRQEIGRKGRGPGEYETPLRASTAGDTLFVWDMTTRRLSAYTADGEFLGATTVAAKASGMPIAAIAEGIVDEIEWGQHTDPQPARGAVVLRTRDGEVQDTLIAGYPVPEIGWEIVDAATGHGRMVNPPALDARAPWALRGDELLFVPPASARLEIRDIPSRALVQVVELPYTARPPTPVQREAYFQALQERLDLPAAVLQQVRSETAFADVVPPITGVMVDDEGSIWLARHDASVLFADHVGSGWDVLDRDGRTLRHVVFPAGFLLSSVADGRAAGIRTTEYGVHVVEIYAVR